MTTARKPHPSDIADEEWAPVAPCLTPPLPEVAGQRLHPLRGAFDGPRYVVWRDGIPWRAGDAPHDLPPWHTVYDQA